MLRSLNISKIQCMQLELHLTKLNVIDRTLEKKTEEVRVGGYQVLCYLKSQKKEYHFMWANIHNFARQGYFACESSDRY